MPIPYPNPLLRGAEIKTRLLRWEYQESGGNDTPEWVGWDSANICRALIQVDEDACDYGDIYALWLGGDWDDVGPSSDGTTRGDRTNHPTLEECLTWAEQYVQDAILQKTGMK